MDDTFEQWWVEYTFFLGFGIERLSPKEIAEAAHKHGFEKGCEKYRVIYATPDMWQEGSNERVGQ